MPIPLLIGVAIGAAGLYKAGKAVSDSGDADDINSDADSIVRRAETRLDTSRKSCQQALAELGQKKSETLLHNVNNFIKVFEKIKNVDFQHDGDLGNLSAREFSEVTIKEMKKSVSFVLTSGLGAGGGAAAGAMVAFGAYNATMFFAAASTTTLISSLSGAAATNATLAWLGGGSLATGGMGMAGGTIALGAIAAGPALLVAGWYMGAKAEKKLNDAHSNKAQAKNFAADVSAAVALTDGIEAVANQASEILSVLRKNSRRSVKKLDGIIAEHGTDFSRYDEESKRIVLRNVKIIQVIKVVLDTPILDEEGTLLGDASTNLANLSVCIQNDFTGLEKL